MSVVESSKPTYLDVTRGPDGRYCVTFTRGGVSRQSYTPSIEQVISQARRAGNLAVRTDDHALRQRCQEAGLTVLDQSAQEY